ncbi:hypothetical protein [Kibdelosporangium aridum]|uniref:STAS domain-containing protein n=1 Tax=Kibdelosporangium aridum TaxID=2030 RepID=A0A1W2A0D9_KIBAR|nr:hypothetical protein [Kibdelosporangium aridum]SMC53922.1 hypothetical protein SAMN05661093_00460 [Kibdelosporangium aridum]
MKTDGLRVDVRYMTGITIARPAGTLDVTTYPTLRDILLKYGAEQPEGLVIELDELAMPSVHALTVFSMVAMRVADWPGVPLVLAAQDEQKRLMLEASSIKRFVPVHASVAKAIAAVGAPQPRRRAAIELPPSTISTRRGRYFVRMHCERWNVGNLATDAMTVVTAFVENTLAHTDSAAFVRMELRRGMLTIAVSDDSPRPAMLRERREGGVPPSGLLLVSAIAKAWGCVPTMTGGKTVWAVLRVPGPLAAVADYQLGE